MTLKSNAHVTWPRRLTACPGQILGAAPRRAPAAHQPERLAGYWSLAGFLPVLLISRAAGRSAVRTGQESSHFVGRNNLEVRDRVGLLKPVPHGLGGIEQLKSNMVVVSPSLQQNEHAWAKTLLIELDEELKQRMAAAETAIFNRMQAISGSSNHGVERQAIEDASGLTTPEFITRRSTLCALGAHKRKRTLPSSRHSAPNGML